MSGTYIYPISREFLNLSGGTVSGNTLFSANLSASTIYSGSTNLYDIFQSVGTDNDHTHLQNGTNTFTGGTASLPTVNVTALTISDITISGNSILNTLTATTVSGGTIYSGATDLYDIFQIVGSDTDHTHLQNGTNTFTGGTSSLPNINVTALTISDIISSGTSAFNTLTATTLSGGTIYSGSTDVSSLFAPPTHSHSQYATLSGATFTDTVLGTAISATILSGGTIYSGATDLYNIFQSIGTDSDHTHLQNGTNTFTGGTASLPTINVTALTIDNITVSGSSAFNAISATTLSGGTVFSGSTNLYDIFQTISSDSGQRTIYGFLFKSNESEVLPTLPRIAQTLTELAIQPTDIASGNSSSLLAEVTCSVYKNGTLITALATSTSTLQTVVLNTDITTTDIVSVALNNPPGTGKQLIVMVSGIIS